MPPLTLVIGNKNYSSWSLRPWLFLRDAGVPFEENRVSLFVETTAEALAPYRSNGKVPVLLDGDQVVWDSLAILEYVSEVYLDGRGWPADRAARAFARCLAAEMHSGFMAMRNELPMNCRRHFPGYALSPAVQKDVSRMKDLWRRARETFGGHGPWLFGAFSIADAMIAPVVLRFVGYDVPVEGIEKAYVDTMLGHPALTEWIAAGKAETEIIAEDEVDL